MAKDNSASVVNLHQVPVKRPLSGAERTRNYRLRQKEDVTSQPVTVTLPAALVTSRMPSLLTMTGYGLAMVGIVINGYFSMSQGATDLAGYIFLALGTLSDVAAAAIPRQASDLWIARRKLASLIAWAIFAMTFSFAICNGLGFTSTNLADVTQARASRETPAVRDARLSLGDAMAARDRECRGGIGRFCRERETTVVSAIAALETARHAALAVADPQAEAATRLVAWLSGGFLRSTGDDFSMVRLILFTVLAQVGGIVLMVGRTR